MTAMGIQSTEDYITRLFYCGRNGYCLTGDALLGLGFGKHPAGFLETDELADPQFAGFGFEQIAGFQGPGRAAQLEVGGIGVSASIAVSGSVIAGLDAGGPADVRRMAESTAASDLSNGEFV